MPSEGQPPLPPDERERLAALRRYEVLDTGPERSFDDLTLLASHICQTPVALVSLVDEDRQWFKSKVGLDADQTPREVAFCAHAIVDNRLLVVPDATHDPRFADNPLVTGDPNIRFYAGTPLVTPDGHGLGTLCVIDMQARQLTPEQTAALEAIGRQVVSQLELRRKILDLEQQEAELRQARREALKANEAKSTFLANMSHELRTPLNAIIGYSELLEEEAADSGVEHLTPDLGKIRSSGRHLLGLINDILDISKIEAGQTELFLEPFDVAGVVRDAAAAVASLVGQNDNQLEIDCADGLGEAVADVTKLRQILYNLLSNAAKFTRCGRITLSARALSEAGTEWIEYRVRDSGIGMTAAQLERVFEAFRQADASTTREYGGTGLGLAISRRLAEAMAGSLVATSTPGEGSSFTLRLPRRVPAPAGAALGAPAPPPPPAQTLEAGATVLVIDDDPAAHELAARTLAREGYRVIGAAGGVEGIEKARAERPDAILLDVTMPGMDGWSVLSLLKADRELAAIPVVMQTMLADRQQAYALGAADYLVKPVDRGKLTAALGRLIGGPLGEVLVVEDDEDTRALVRRTIERAGGTVIEAADGRQALERLAEARPQLILLDLMMPRMNGFELLEEMRRDPRLDAVPVVVLTAKSLSAEDRRRLDGAVRGILEKATCSASRLIEEIRPLLG